MELVQFAYQEVDVHTQLSLRIQLLSDPRLEEVVYQFWGLKHTLEDGVKVACVSNIFEAYYVDLL